MANMQSFLRHRGGNFLFMRIDNYKAPGRKPWFHNPRFRKLVKDGGGQANKILDDSHNWVAIDLPNDVIIDVDWKDNFEPDEGQLEAWKYFEENFPYYKSATKKVWGMHFIVPRKKFKNLPDQGNPRLSRLCTDRHQVEVLLELPTIVSRQTFLTYQIRTDKPCPEIDYFTYTQPRLASVREGYRCIAGGTQRVTWADENKADAELRKYLGMLSGERCDDRETWFQVGCVCKALGDKTAFYDWSKQSAKFDPEEQDKMWNSLKHASDFGLGTIIHYAKQDSPEEYKAYVFTYERAKEKLEAEGLAFNKRTKKLICDGVEISHVDAKNYFAPIQYYFAPKDEMRQVFAKWITDHQRKTYTDVVFEPYNPKQGDQSKDTEYNMFDKMNFEYIEGTTEDDLYFLKLLIEANCMQENARTWALDYICDIVQNPASKPQTGIVFKGHAGGSGKGTLVELIQSVVGKKFVHSTNNLDDYFGNFNHGIDSTLLCVCEEVSATDGVKHKEAIKTALTDVINIINMKNRQPVKQASYNRWLFNSNNKTAVLSDRRFLQLQTNPGKIIPQKTFDDFHGIWKKDQDWINRVGSAMLDHKITSILTRVPQVSSDTMRHESNIEPIHMVLKFMHTGGIELFENKYIKSADLRAACLDMCERMHMPRKYTEKNLYHMKHWTEQEYANAFTKKKEKINGQYTQWIKIDLPMVVDMMRLNNLYPSDDYVIETLGEDYIQES